MSVVWDPKLGDAGRFWKLEKPSVAAAVAEEAVQLGCSINTIQRVLWVRC